MKLRDLNHPYCNLDPNFVFSSYKEAQEEINIFIELFCYARKLEEEVKRIRKERNTYLKEVRNLNYALKRQQRRTERQKYKVEVLTKLLSERESENES